jgi:hypothetical protein
MIMANLMKYEDGSYIRPATADETAASLAAAKRDSGVGAITVGDITCYVDSPAIAYRVRVWDEGFSAEWTIDAEDEIAIVNSGGIPKRVIQSATDTLLVNINVRKLGTVSNLVACEFIGDGEDAIDMPNCTIEAE